MSGLHLATEAGRDRAAMRLRAVMRAQELLCEGHSRLQAETIAAEEHGVSRGSVMRWMKRTGAAPVVDAASLLEAARRGRPRVAWDTPGAQEAWRIWRADYLRLEGPGSAACWRRVKTIARRRGWSVPCERLFRLRLYREVSPEEIVRAREGVLAALAMYPAQVRTVAGMLPLDCVSGDGKRHDVFARTADGRVLRPVGWYWQDVRTRKILAWCVGETENQDLVRIAFTRMTDAHGVPRVMVIDNTFAASANALTTRWKRRWKSDEEDCWGIFDLLGCRVVRTHLEREDDGKNYGWGQAKPVERAFGDLAEGIEKHPQCRGAYAGRNTTAKPANYGSGAVPWETFLGVVADAVREYNERPGRRMEAAAGRSIDEVWAEELASTPVRRLSSEQRSLLLLAPEPVTVKPDGTFVLSAGKAAGLPANRYQADELRALIHRLPGNRRVVARFDPDDLHAGVHVYDLNGQYLCFADCLDPVGFLDTEAAREHNRERRRYKRGLDQAQKARERMEDMVERHRIEPVAPGPGVKPKVVELVSPKQRRRAEAAQDARENTMDRLARGAGRMLDKG